MEPKPDLTQIMEEIQKLTLRYNLSVQPQERIIVEKSANTLQLMMSNREIEINRERPSLRTGTTDKVLSENAKEQEKLKRPSKYMKLTSTEK